MKTYIFNFFSLIVQSTLKDLFEDLHWTLHDMDKISFEWK